MKAGIIGFPGSGRDTVFRALTSLPAQSGLNRERVGEALVDDPRLNWLSDLFKPKKHTPARVDLVSVRPQAQNAKEALKLSLDKVRECDVLLIVARNFPFPGSEDPNPLAEAREIFSEFLVSDYVTVEKRLERLAEEKKRGKKNDPAELELLNLAKDMLENDVPLKNEKRVVEAPFLRGFGFFSAKPALVIANGPDSGGPLVESAGPLRCLNLRGNLEAEIGRLEPEEAKEFLADYGLGEPAGARVVKTIFDMTDLISFFTVGEDECRAWTLSRGEDALAAAGKIHSDIKKGFIRAEVVSFADFEDCGGFAEAKKRGLFRLEGKTYVVADGDIVHFRFNV
ncbi:MAG: DUF933 domain-containing protein [Deltaproteobacteria bacterium]|jgi:ribosome-binding ATPase YchF (GTP1/OBG family)|nr:DUF933 domain-containing protein [Deltaproteobacteria bacterium]